MKMKKMNINILMIFFILLIISWCKNIIKWEVLDWWKWNLETLNNLDEDSSVLLDEVSNEIWDNLEESLKEVIEEKENLSIK